MIDNRPCGLGRTYRIDSVGDIFVCLRVEVLDGDDAAAADPLVAHVFRPLQPGVVADELVERRASAESVRH